jgi:hypothetical protein
VCRKGPAGGNARKTPGGRFTATGIEVVNAAGTSEPKDEREEG